MAYHNRNLSKKSFSVKIHTFLIRVWVLVIVCYSCSYQRLQITLVSLFLSPLLPLELAYVPHFRVFFNALSPCWNLAGVRWGRGGERSPNYICLLGACVSGDHASVSPMINFNLPPLLFPCCMVPSRTFLKP